MTYPDGKTLAEKELPVFRALRIEESRSDKQGTCDAQRQFDVAHVEDAADDQAGDEDQSILDAEAEVNICLLASMIFQAACLYRANPRTKNHVSRSSSWGEENVLTSLTVMFPGEY